MGREARRRREKRAETEALRAAQSRGPGGLVQQFEYRRRSGPIPDAEQLLEYADVDPDLPMRIVGWTEAESAHRRSLETQAVAAEIDGAKDLRTITKRGQLFGLLLGWGCILGGVAIGIWGSGDGSWIGGSLLGGGGLAALIWGPKQNPAALPVGPPEPKDDGAKGD